MFGETPFAGVDLDKVPRPGHRSDRALGARDHDRLNSYTEISPSGAGIHVIVEAVLPPTGRKKGPLEMYDSGRYFTVTGKRLAGTPQTIEKRQAELDALHSSTFAGRPAPTGTGRQLFPGQTKN